MDSLVTWSMPVLWESAFKNPPDFRTLLLSQLFVIYHFQIKGVLKVHISTQVVFERVILTALFKWKMALPFFSVNDRDNDK